MEMFEPKTKNVYRNIEAYFVLPDEQLRRLQEILVEGKGHRENEILATVPIRFQKGGCTYAGTIDIVWSEECKRTLFKTAIQKFDSKTSKKEAVYTLTKSDDPFDSGEFFYEDENCNELHIYIYSEVDCGW